jgi:hypothetical protein
MHLVHDPDLHLASIVNPITAQMTDVHTIPEKCECCGQEVPE